MKKNQMKVWTAKQINQHKEAGTKLALIKEEFKQFLAEPKTALTELDCVTFIKKSYAKHGLINDSKKEFAIVAFGKHTNQVHYFPTQETNKKLTPNTLILLDIWARLNKKNAPYADVTFMFYFGKKVSKQIQKTWEVLTQARDIAVEYIKKELKKAKIPRGLDIDRVAHDIIGEAGLGQGIKHTIGHSLGFESPHGKLPGINWREYSLLQKNVGYTIEPGIYLEKFGMRSEIDFYIDQEDNVVITTPLQTDIFML